MKALQLAPLTVLSGIAGCVPHGSDSFSLGCSVSTEYGPIHLDVTVQVEPEVQIIEERLSGPTNKGHRDVLVSGEPSPHVGDLHAAWHNGKRGPNPSAPFRSFRLLTSQLPLRVGGETEGKRDSILVRRDHAVRARERLPSRSGAASDAPVRTLAGQQPTAHR